MTDDDGVSDVTDASDAVDAELTLANEFASVVVRRVSTRNGVRLRIESPRSGSAIDLDPIELETLTWQTHELFSQLLRDPHGPDD